MIEDYISTEEQEESGKEVEEKETTDKAGWFEIESEGEVAKVKIVGDINEEMIEKIMEQVSGKIKILVDFSNAKQGAAKIRKRFIEDVEGKYLNKVGFCGISGFTGIYASFISRIFRIKNIKYFKTEEQASKWLNR